MEKVSQSRKPNLILLIDRTNLVGIAVASVIEKSATTVLVTAEKITEDSTVISVPFTHPIPQIPEGTYTHTLFVWDEQSGHLLEPLVKKAQEWSIHMYVVLTREDEGVAEKIKGLGVTVLILGDLFGAKEKKPLDVFLESAKSTKRIILSGMGLHEWYPVLFMDAVRGIAELLISTKRGGVVLLIGPSHPMTALSIAHLLQKINPEILIDFSGSKEERHERKMTSLLNDYDASEKLKEYFRLLKYRKNIKESESIVFSKSPKKSSKKRNIGLYLVYALFTFLLLPFLLIAVGGGVGALFLSLGIQDAEKGKIVDGLQKVRAARINFSIAQNSSTAIGEITSLLFPSDPLRVVRKQVMVGYQLSQIVDEGISAGAKLSEVMTGKSNNPKEDAEEAVGNLKHTSELLSSVSEQDMPVPFRELLKSAKTLSILGSSVVDELPSVLGVSGDKKYLILFQNSMELRPGGGFIGSYGLLTLKNGAIKNFSIHDVYDADGQLKGHIEPPFAIRRYIPIVHLYLRDSNFDPDFSRDAQIATFMLSQETGDRVDGVVGIDLNVLKGILASVGSVYVPSYGQTVTEQNFFQLLEEHAEKNFFPGSTQKKDFLNTFSSALMLKVQQGLNGKILLEKILSLLVEKHIAFGFADPSLQTPFSLAGISGTLTDTRSTQPSTLNDFFGIVEANLGVNKANAFIARKVSQQVNIQDGGDVQETVSLTLSNNSDGTWPGGVYRNYVRFALSQNARLDTISLDSVNQEIVDAIIDPSVYESKSFIAPKGLEVSREEQQGKVLYGFLITVPIKDSVEVVVSYTIPHAFLGNELKQVYSLFLWKQMGIDPYLYELNISIPDSLKMLTSSIPLTQQQQALHYSGSVEKDTVISLKLIRK